MFDFDYHLKRKDINELHSELGHPSKKITRTAGTVMDL